MSSLKVYEYSACSTCKNARKFLDSKNVKYRAIPIVEQPPTKVELEAMLAHVKANGGEIKKLFNTSGVLYKEMRIADKISRMSESESFDLLGRYGKLIKRPFVLGKDFGLLGFKQEQWEEYI